jgi:RNA polymerase sigma-70 factor (ECF subfamily)
MIYCVVPQDLADKLHEPLRRHFRAAPDVEVVVEQRHGERRRTTRRSGAGASIGRAGERRRIRNPEGRRVADRRAATVEADPPSLPRQAQRYADRIRFMARVAPSSEQAEDADTSRLVIRIQGGERELFAELYMRYFDRVYSYLRLALDDPHEAEDATQQVFLRVMEALPRYERRRTPFRGWLFTVVRNQALTLLQRHNRVEVVDPGELVEHRGGMVGSRADELRALGWINDGELLMFVERLPLAQRQVLMLRYMLDLSDAQTAAILGRSRADVRVLQSRAIHFLRKRLAAVGRESERDGTARMRRVRRQVTVLRARRWALVP